MGASIDHRFNGLRRALQGDAVGWFVVPRWGGVDEADAMLGRGANRSVGVVAGDRAGRELRAGARMKLCVVTQFTVRPKRLFSNF